MDWKLTRNAIGEPEIVNLREDEAEDLRRGFSLLRELAAADDTMIEVAPNVWRCLKTTSVREF